MPETRPRPDLVENADNNGPESIVVRKLRERYTFFDDADVKAYYYKKRTLTTQQFIAYEDNLNMIERLVRRSVSPPPSHSYLNDTQDFKGSIPRRKKPKSYRKVLVDPNIEPQGLLDPFKFLSDPTGLKTLSEQIPDVLETIGEKLPDSNERKEFMGLFKTFQEKIPNLYLPSGSDTLEKATSLLTGFGNLSPTILIVVAASWYAHSRSWTSFGFFVACAIYFVIKVPDQLYLLFKIYVNSYAKIPFLGDDIAMDEIVPQMSDDTLEVIGTSIATILIAAVGVKSKLTGAALALTFVKEFSRAKMGMVEIAKIVLRLVEKAVNYFREECLDLPSIKFINSCSKEIDNFSEEVRVYTFQFNKRTIDRTELTYSNLVALLAVGKHLLKNIPRDKFTDSTVRDIHTDCSTLNKIITDFEREDITLRGTRQEPAAILLSGGPGVGKSIAALYTTVVVTRGVCTDEEKLEFDVNPGPYVFSRKLENVFFDSLTNKAKTFLYDDFMQLRDAPGISSEAMEIIRVVNTEEYSAHMAHLENKGNVYVRPKFVIATTNQVVLNSNAIVNVNAMKRRFDLSYIVVPKEEYVRDEDLCNDIWNRKLDRNKLPKATVIDPIDKIVHGHEISDLRPDCLLYYEHDLLRDEIGDPIEFDELIRRCRDTEVTKRHRFALHMENHKKLIAKYAKVFETEPEPDKLSPDYSYTPSDDDDDSEFEEDNEYLVDSVTATPEQKAHLEYLIIVDNVYKRYLLEILGPYGCVTVDDMIDVLLDTLGYAFSKRLLINREKVPDKAKFRNHRRKKKFAIRVLNKMQDIVNYFLSFIPSFKSVKQFIVEDEEPILLLLGILACSGIMVMIGKWCYNWWTGKPEPQSFGFSDKMREPKTHAKHFKDAKAVKAYINAPVNLTPQGGEDPSGVDLILSFTRRNCFILETLNDAGTWNKMGSITFITGRIGLMTYHFIPKWMNSIIKDRSKLKRLIRLSHGNDVNSPGLLFTVEEFLNGHQTGCLQKKDAVLVELPKRFPERPSIIDRFALRKDLEHNTRNLEVVLPKVSTYNGYFFGPAQRNRDTVGIYDKIPGYDYEISEGFQYDIPTKAGDCGTLMCILNPSIPVRKIFGIHVAGNTYHGQGYASVITQEELLEDLKLFDVPIITEEPDMLVPQSGDFDQPLRFEIIGRVNRSPMRNTNTEIRRSRMFEKLQESFLSPAMLRTTLVDGTLIDPLLNAQRKYCKPDIYIDPDLIREACRSYFDYCEWQEVYTVDRVVYSVDEAIFGLEYDYDYGSINSSSSAGYPMTISGERNLKKELFSCEYDSPEQKVIFEEIAQMVYELIEKCKKGIRSFVVFSDNLKDELRELQKVVAGSTRLFSGAPFIYLIAFRMYFGAFSLWYMKNRINNGSAIGVNPYSSEWNTIATKLIEISPKNIGAGDQEKYDGSQKPVVHLFMLDDINRWYGGCYIDNLIRSILWMEIYNSKHIIDGVIFEWLSSLPSGHPFTIIVNTIYHHIISRYNWRRAIGSLKDYNSNTYTVVLGDDIAYSVSEAFTALFNDIVFAKHSTELGMNYQIESKSGELIARRHITEIEFLKRSFVYDCNENLFIAPLKMQSIMKMLDWTKKKHRNAIVASNVITAVRELSLHNEVVYDKYVPLINDNFKFYYPRLSTSEPILEDHMTRRSKVLGSVVFF
jgi:hypothetical protein